MDKSNVGRIGSDQIDQIRSLFRGVDISEGRYTSLGLYIRPKRSKRSMACFPGGICMTCDDI